MLFLDISLRQKVTIQNKDICTGTFTDSFFLRTSFIVPDKRGEHNNASHSLYNIIVQYESVCTRPGNYRRYLERLF